MSFHANLTHMKRPRILVKAAQICAQTYEREKVLKRILHCTSLPTHAGAIAKIQEHEELQNEARLTGDASYKVQHHITLLGALLGEMQLLGN